ncbi:ABC transporter ATP-binding protein [Actinomadura decatromicini]|uniref:ABC transporter ATP-binding protein n=1 Tax=Actinomadura decatromicini TaxID=2604572 RepID=A0A5D3F716_9ACTN|nr:ABC transporter ATP-binding protein [Actinomadura decatromicini]TYK43490.1 ABC transporter ATP-binding protein [Actinomadura decatromicini]
MSSIELRQVTKRFGDTLIVDSIDLTIEDGSFTVLLGPSGCGKTTTLNMISGLEEVSSGTILFDGKEVQDVPPHKRDVAMVFQSYALYPNRSVRENISFALKLRKLPAADIAARVAEVAEMLDIAGLLDRKPRQLSGGQQQRVALARAIVRRPNVFLLDEPLSNLDAKLRADMRISLRELQRELGGTFVYVTHDQGEAMSMADKVVVMNGGLVQQEAPPLDLYRRPANRFVAGFVGTPGMNFVPGALDDAGSFAHGDWTVPIGWPGAARDGVTLGVRPEDVTLEPGGPGAVGRVRLIERLGVEAIVVASFPSGDVIARADPDVEMDAGAEVAMRVRPGKAHLFDAEDGGALAWPSAPKVAEEVGNA